jgi:putative membrane protein
LLTPTVPPASAWSGSAIHLDVVVAVALLAGAYAGALVRGRSDRSPLRAAAFFFGLGALLVATNGPLHVLSEHHLFTAHMVQHLILTLVVVPLLLVGTPGWMIDALLARVCTRPTLARALRWATRPVPAIGAYTVALVVWHLPGPYAAALTSHAWHFAEHALLMGTAVLAWWPVLSTSRMVPGLHYGAQILYLFVFGVPMTVVAAMITTAETVLYPFYGQAPVAFGLTPLDDQRLGGVIMWVPAGLIPLVAFTLVFFRWVAAERDDAVDADALPK